MKFETKAKCYKLHKRIRKWLSRRTLYHLIYKEVLDDLVMNDRDSIRYYLNSYVQLGNSFKARYESYHEHYNINTNLHCMEDCFHYTFNYISEKLFRYEDIKVTYSYDEDGYYYEIKRLKNIK